MIKKIKNKIIFIILFLSFLAFSRLLQSIIISNSNNELNVSLFNRTNKNDKCQPKQDSLINYLQSQNSKSIFLILDGYPIPKLFKAYSKRDSIMHLNLKKSSDFNKTYEGNYKWTKYSLAYILGGINKSKEKCIYPTFGNKFKPIFINSSQYYYSDESLCKASITEFNERIIYYPQKILDKIDRNYFSIGKYNNVLRNRKKNCSLINSDLNISINNWIRNHKTLDNNIYIFHEIYFHDFIETNREEIHKLSGFINLENDLYLSDLLKIDKLYDMSLDDLLERLKKELQIKNIFVLSDHGPRTNLYEGKDLSSLESKSFFIYYFGVQGKDKNIINILKNL